MKLIEKEEDKVEEKIKDLISKYRVKISNAEYNLKKPKADDPSKGEFYVSITRLSMCDQVIGDLSNLLNFYQKSLLPEDITEDITEEKTEEPIKIYVPNYLKYLGYIVGSIIALFIHFFFGIGIIIGTFVGIRTMNYILSKRSVSVITNPYIQEVEDRIHNRIPLDTGQFKHLTRKAKKDDENE